MTSLVRLLCVGHLVWSLTVEVNIHVTMLHVTRCSAWSATYWTHAALSLTCCVLKHCTYTDTCVYGTKIWDVIISIMATFHVYYDFNHQKVQHRPDLKRIIMQWSPMEKGRLCFAINCKKNLCCYHCHHYFTDICMQEKLLQVRMQII